ncbi:MAG: glycosyltransferase family 2 protein [Candidatus Omnitrophota bacterium]
MTGTVKLSIIIPAYNEAGTLLQVVARARSSSLPSGIEREICVVDDGSTDGTRDLLRQWEGASDVRIVTLGRNFGKMAAMRAGVEASSGKYVVIQDADLEYSPVYYGTMLAPLLAGEASVVLGSRFLGSAKEMRWEVRWANHFNNWLVNRLYGCSLTDVNSGLKIFPRDLFRSLRITSGRFGGEAEVTCRLLRMKKRIKEIPIDYVARSRAEGKKMDLFHALHVLGCFIYHRFS